MAIPRKTKTVRRKKQRIGGRKPASRTKPPGSVRFPNETPVYRKARNELLAAEITLRRAVEKVAALRRKLPRGGRITEDYLFEAAGQDDSTRGVRLSELFTTGRDSLLIYSFMYGPQMERACPSCTSILDGLDGMAPHIGQRTNLVVVAKSPLPRILAFARERGWRNLRMLSSQGNTYNRDYHGEHAQWGQMPMLNVFTRKDGIVRHFWGSELLYTPPDPAQDPRHVDLLWPLWNALDLTPEGRGTDWRPSLDYAPNARACCD
ncbi:MAG: DUF899 family protein [Gammaproteobacteria bacterium]|nr:DUF899 family protein [Gammaproteobacteria bacterium]